MPFTSYCYNHSPMTGEAGAAHKYYKSVKWDTLFILLIEETN
jgi:hypothetical protein